MSVIAITIFVVAYALIASDRVSKTLVALAGAGIMLAVRVVGSHDAFYSSQTGIDWDVIFLLLGMMIIVGVLRQTGVFEYVAIWAVKRAKGSPRRIMILLVLVMAFGSAMLDNVTTVLLIAPVTLLVCDRLAINASPFLMAEVFASNIGGAATLVGDPPNIIIASRAGLTFNDFLIHMAPIVLIVLVVFVALLPVLFGSIAVEADRVADVMSLDEREAIRDTGLLIKCGVVLLLVFAAFVAHPVLHIQPSVVALLGAGVLVVISGLERSDYLSSVEWDTLLFFAGLFVMVGALVKTGVVDKLARAATELTGGNETLTVFLILGASAPISGIIDNIPYVATMTPIVTELVAAMPGHIHPNTLWWALALGADLGGNLTAVGASANVVMLGIARRAGTPISFWEFTRKGFVVTAVSIALSAIYLWLRYFVLG
ncbi:arsenical pump membrane family protein [Mycobacterium kansasii 732]|uniref:Putative transporter n=1 Tax=Mycobacterium pseudokansasii TaxID=2341080 RepID=A0A498QV41_9MYCO|nr:ArsB/NhaD family transporter [Mycobacterium pseudokansasii]EUA09532.1 arsenical pump membrane family protein [Mycobacterium kansasii 732]MBY0388755.1 ArsB/NhaD family transporter [Mycobacterium pseudokansasii]VAZ93274.1 putative transporter [Mycobacterium pseudokansasii]VAZ94223.1 putative transporter [Mycobacterium pseudokansasii]VBA49696.1 putative transporter [Mycobacterium pseudokansasii]